MLRLSVHKNIMDHNYHMHLEYYYRYFIRQWLLANEQLLDFDL